MNGTLPGEPAQATSVVDAPWIRPDLLQEHPEDIPVGYIEDGKIIQCTEEELVTRAGQDKPRRIVVGWTHGFRRLVTLFEIPALAGVMADRVRREQRKRMIGSLILLPFLSVILWMVRDEPRLRQWWLAILASVVFAPLLQAIMELYRLKRAPAEVYAAQAAEMRYRFWESSMPMWLTQRGFWVLWGVYAVQLFTGELASIEKAGLVNNAVRSGEWTRLLTAPLLHGSLAHIWFNSISWRAVARTIEALSGWAILAIVFLTSAVGGCFASLWWHPQITSVGASGGICGLVGFCLLFGLRYRRVLPRDFAPGWIWTIGLLVMIGFLAPDVVDNAGHAGGFLTGALLGVALVGTRGSRLPLQSGRLTRALGTGALMVLGASVVYVAMRLLV